MDTMDCAQARNLLSEHQDRTLDTAAAAALGAHLRGCGECVGADASLLAVRGLLRSLPLDPAPPELLARVLAAVEAEDRDARAISAPGGADAARPFLSRFRVLLEAAAVVLLFASVYWYRQTSTPAVGPPTEVSSVISSETGKASASRPHPTEKGTEKSAPTEVHLAKKEPKTSKGESSYALKPRVWTAESLPSVPVYFASTGSERIVPFVPPAPLATFPYGRDIFVDVNPENREGAEERIAGIASRFDGIVERVARERGSAENGTTGTIRVILPERTATGFLDELRRIGTVPPEGPPGAIDIPRGPRPGTVAYAVRIRVR